MPAVATSHRHQVRRSQFRNASGTASLAIRNWPLESYREDLVGARGGREVCGLRAPGDDGPTVGFHRHRVRPITAGPTEERRPDQRGIDRQRSVTVPSRGHESVALGTAQPESTLDLASLANPARFPRLGWGLRELAMCGRDSQLAIGRDRQPKRPLDVHDDS